MHIVYIPAKTGWSTSQAVHDPTQGTDSVQTTHAQWRKL
jgi:hypothetical protein